MIRPPISGRFFWGLALPEGRGRTVAVAVLVALLHVGLIWALVHGLAGGVVALVRESLPGLVAEAIPLEPPATAPAPHPRVAARQSAGATGAMGRKARPMAVAAPPPRFVLAAPPAAPVAADGNQTLSGAGASGAGTGGGLAGNGTGAGGSGDGMGGGGGASKPVKTAGDITAARDYPPQGRADRAGKRVIIVLRVGTDGHPTGCRIHAPSGNDEADAITCRLALQRFRFRPALDRDGNPVAADYGWEQRWWAP